MNRSRLKSTDFLVGQRVIVLFPLGVNTQPGAVGWVMRIDNSMNLMYVEWEERRGGDWYHPWRFMPYSAEKRVKQAYYALARLYFYG